MKIKGIKKAVGDYQRANAGGYYSPQYGNLMLDLETGELWTDEFYSLGHNQWKEYKSDKIIDLGKRIEAKGLEVNMKNVKEYCEKL